MAKEIENCMKSKATKHKLFALKLDKSWDINGKTKVLVFIRLVDNGIRVDDFFC